MSSRRRANRALQKATGYSMMGCGMADIDKEIQYWKQGAMEDWDVAVQLVGSTKIRHGLFFAHLAFEKALKAHLCRQSRNHPPRIHNLVRLAEMAELKMNSEQLDVLADTNEFNLEGRYPLTYLDPPTAAEANRYLDQAKEMFEWLIQAL